MAEQRGIGMTLQAINELETRVSNIQKKGVKGKIKVITNDGKVIVRGKKFTLMCFWKSIQQFVNVNLKSLYDVTGIAIEYGVSNEMFDAGNEVHVGILSQIAADLNVGVRLFTFKNFDTIDGVINLFTENKKHIIPILWYGAHFDLIIDGTTYLNEDEQEFKHEMNATDAFASFNVHIAQNIAHHFTHVVGQTRVDAKVDEKQTLAAQIARDEQVAREIDRRLNDSVRIKQDEKLAKEIDKSLNNQARIKLNEQAARDIDRRLNNPVRIRQVASDAAYARSLAGRV
jgi:hypothetical protein